MLSGSPGIGCPEAEEKVTVASSDAMICQKLCALSREDRIAGPLLRRQVGRDVLVAPSAGRHHLLHRHVGRVQSAGALTIGGRDVPREHRHALVGCDDRPRGIVVIVRAGLVKHVAVVLEHDRHRHRHLRQPGRVDPQRRVVLGRHHQVLRGAALRAGNRVDLGRVELLVRHCHVVRAQRVRGQHHGARAAGGHAVGVAALDHHHGDRRVADHAARRGRSRRRIARAETPGPPASPR